jgi:RNA polymerase sigma-70 factor (ECF subfamily)
MVFALSSLLLRDRQEAEDATQQCFLSVHRSLLAGTVPDDPAPWVAAIARNECLTRLRRRRAETVELMEHDHPTGGDLSDVAAERAEIAALSQAIAGLPPAQRQAVVLRDFYGLSYREVSLALGVSGPAVESLLFKSRKRLQERLRPLRAAAGLATLPATVRDALAQLIPGFSGAAATSGASSAGIAATAKLLSWPVAAKIAAVLVATAAGAAAIAGVTLRGDRHQTAPAATFPWLGPVGADVALAAPRAIHRPAHRIERPPVHKPTAQVRRRHPHPSRPAPAPPPTPSPRTTSVPPSPPPPTVRTVVAVPARAIHTPAPATRSPVRSAPAVVPDIHHSEAAAPRDGGTAESGVAGVSDGSGDPNPRRGNSLATAGPGPSDDGRDDGPAPAPPPAPAPAPLPAATPPSAAPPAAGDGGDNITIPTTTTAPSTTTNDGSGAGDVVTNDGTGTNEVVAGSDGGATTGTVATTDGTMTSDETTTTDETTTSNDGTDGHGGTNSGSGSASDGGDGGHSGRD